MSEHWNDLEVRRRKLQVTLDAERSSRQRNEAGQFATPPALANEIARYALSLHDATEVDFIEPSCGSGSFFSALLMQSKDKKIRSALGVELDQRFADAARETWESEGLTVIPGDFTDPLTVPSHEASLLIANPPYVRHHHLTSPNKKRLGEISFNQVGIKPSGLSGLYVYFVLLSHRLLAPGAVSAWLIPSEFMDVNYGKSLKQYLAKNVTLLRVHQFDAAEVQFDDALVTSSVVVFKNEPADPNFEASFSFGGNLANPRVDHKIRIADINPAIKWSRYIHGADQASTSGPVLSDFFKIRRGLATGSNSFFILNRKEAQQIGISEEFLRPVLPSPRGLKTDVIGSDSSNWPLIPNQLALIDCAHPIEKIRLDNPALAAYLDGADEKITSGYLVSRRNPWYKQEERDPAPILLTYMGRGKDDEHPLRFILNHSGAVATNMYLMLYPTLRLKKYLDLDPDGIVQVHKALLSMPASDIRGGGRVYGGGLHKMEPKELSSLPADCIVSLAPDILGEPQQPSLI